jgi:5'-nucleotidase
VRYGGKNLDIIISLNTCDKMGGYVRKCSGLQTYFKAESSENYRINEMRVTQKQMNFDKVYNVTCVTTQGVPSKYGKEKMNQK